MPFLGPFFYPNVTIPDGDRRDVIFLCIDLTDWWNIKVSDKGLFEDNWFETVKKRVQYIMGWLATLLTRLPKLRKIAYLLNKDSAISTRIINYHIHNQNKIGINPVFIAQREKPKNETNYIHWTVKRLFNAARGGEISLVAADGNTGIPENESGSYREFKFTQFKFFHDFLKISNFFENTLL